MVLPAGGHAQAGVCRSGLVPGPDTAARAAGVPPNTHLSLLGLALLHEALSKLQSPGFKAVRRALDGTHNLSLLKGKHVCIHKSSIRTATRQDVPCTASITDGVQETRQGQWLPHPHLPGSAAHMNERVVLPNDPLLAWHTQHCVHGGVWDRYFKLLQANYPSCYASKGSRLTQCQHMIRVLCSRLLEAPLTQPCSHQLLLPGAMCVPPCQHGHKVLLLQEWQSIFWPLVLFPLHLLPAFAYWRRLKSSFSSPHYVPSPGIE